MLQGMLCSRLEVYSRMLYGLLFMYKVYFGPDNFTGRVEFVLGVIIANLMIARF